ncbi:hypothetical protein PAXRUDRAFT_824794 [Paxillus rubicundulus Ve08.2h10]|uniref:Uncharacterized protein n=1 Tax=Paxillus rubicundulus Ve08.2h10 TaxID=930991 RepID=A0A0D0EBG6_9AGAM|nr:hypothetical protein PAXRUDRAFT_824794 [Paxillus rubicundulus Ve08.2h10]
MPPPRVLHIIMYANNWLPCESATHLDPRGPFCEVIYKADFSCAINPWKTLTGATSVIKSLRELRSVAFIIMKSCPCGKTPIIFVEKR